VGGLFQIGSDVYADVDWGVLPLLSPEVHDQQWLVEVINDQRVALCWSGSDRSFQLVH
jgi:sorbitol-specific phosphotransferase system component IIC